MKEDKFLSGFMLHRLRVALVDTRLYSKNEAKQIIKEAKPITSSLIGRVENLSHRNPLSSNIQFAFPIIGVWLSSNKKISIDKITILIEHALNSKLVRLFYSAYDFNREKDAKKFLNSMKRYADWHDKHMDEDACGWKYVFDDNLHKKGCSYGFKFCPIADFCLKNGYQEIAPLLCSIDYATFKMCHGKLIRNHKLAQGDDICDFWIVGDKEKNIE